MLPYVALYLLHGIGLSVFFLVYHNFSGRLRPAGSDPSGGGGGGGGDGLV